jgi:hypothetical protein
MMIKIEILIFSKAKAKVKTNVSFNFETKIIIFKKTENCSSNLLQIVRNNHKKVSFHLHLL